MIAEYYMCNSQLVMREFNYIQMENRLGRIKTTYGEGANYDEEEYFQEKRKIYNREIEFSNRVNAITDHQFALRPLEMGFMQSTALKDEPKFKEIRKILTEYNKNVLESGGKAVNGLHLKTVVMDSMLKFMRMMMLAPDTNTKKVILDIAHHWFIRHLDPKGKKKTTAQLERQIKDILVKKELLPIDVINKQLILTRVQENMRPYKMKARTMYKQLDAPDIELQTYHTHKLEFLAAIPTETKEKKNTKWIDNVKFPKIQAPAYYFEAEVEELPKEDQNKNFATEQTAADQQPPPGLQQGQAQGTGQNGLNPIDGNNPKPDENQNGQDLDFGGEPEAEPQVEELMEEEEDKNKGKLNPLVKAFLLERIRSKQREQFGADRKLEQKYNKINKTQMEDYQDANFIRNWAVGKARLKTQINRKHQSMKGVEKIPRGRAESTRKYIENEMEILKVHKTVSQYDKNISKVEIPTDPLNSEEGLSLFDKRRVKTEATQKPFSTILEDHSKRNQRTQAIDEIGYLKQRLAKYRLYTPVDTLTKGLLQPLEKDEVLMQENQGKVVWSNSQMFSNPFFKIAKKKKKKKKKK